MKVVATCLCLMLILVGTVDAAMEETKQVTIDDGLAWLAGVQSDDGAEGWWSYANDGTLATTAAVALAFIEDGFLPGEDVIIHETNYGDVVGLAVAYIFNRAGVDSRFGIETAIYERYAEDYNNDGNYDNDGGNDQAIYFEPGADNRRVYTTGIVVPVVYALGQALGQDTLIGFGSETVQDMTYAQLLQDLIDWFCFAQVEPDLGNYRGGWRYDANWISSDNSTAQWGALPLLYAASWELGVPQYVKDELTRWADYIQNDSSGGSGYSEPNEYVNVSKTGGLLLEFAAIGRQVDDASVQAALGFIDSRWNTTVNSWYGNLNNAYAMWAVYKGLETYGLTDYLWYGAGDEDDVLFGYGMPSAPGGFTIGWDIDPEVSLPGDWYSHYCDYLVGLQNGDGSWSGAESWTGALATGWYLNIINAAGAPPVQCVTATVEEPIYLERHLSVPISLSNVEDHQTITGIDLTFDYDPIILDPTGVSFDGTILQDMGWGHMFNVPAPGELRVGLAGVDPLLESGMLIYLEFDIAETAPCDGETFLALDVLLNEGEPCVLIDGAVSWQMPLTTVTGEVSFWGCGMVGNDNPPIPEVTIEMAGYPSETVQTDETGSFFIPACYDSCYTLTPSKPCGETEGISSLDAALILRYFVGLETLDECPIQPMEMWDGSICPEEEVLPQLLAADASGNGSIHSFDASIILKYIVGEDMSEFRVGCWDFFCADREFCVEGDLTEGLDFVGLLIGDVTGNYGLEFPREAFEDSDAALVVSKVDGEPGATVEVPVSLLQADGFYGLQCGIAFDPTVLRIDGVAPSEMADGCLFEWHVSGNDLCIAAAGAQGIEGSGEFCRIECTVLSVPANGLCLLDLHDARADERPELLTMNDGGVQVSWADTPTRDAIPPTYLLRAPSPNPLGQFSTVAFDVPSGGGHVQLQVLDMTGRVVSTLHDGFVGPGHHGVVWDGTDHAGRALMSGAYVIRLLAPGHDQVQKVTLVR